VTGPIEYSGALIVARPSANDPYTAAVQDAHITLLWFGEAARLPEALLPAISERCAEVAAQFEPIDVKVSGVGILGPDKASVLLLESAELVAIRAELCEHPAVQQAWEMTPQYPWMVYHLTTGYNGVVPKNPPETVHVDALGFWAGPTRVDHALGFTDQPMSAAACPIPPIECLADLSVGMHYASENPSARWYVAKRAQALGAEQRIPESWMVTT
jgi:2'-5' RNA ligase